MRSIDESFYKSRAWKDCRSQYLDRVNHLCERCQSKGIFVPARFVHHKIYLDDSNYRDASISLNFRNLEALCFDCHNADCSAQNAHPAIPY